MINDTAQHAVSDLDIVKLLVEQSEQGLRLLLEVHGGRIRGWLQRKYGQVLQEQEIDDALNQATFNVWRFCDRYDEAKGSLSSWYLRIAQRTAISILRAEHRHHFAPLLDEPADFDPNQSPDLNDEDRALLQQMDDAINKLPRLQQAIIKADLAANGTADARRLAKVLGTTEGSIYVSRNKAIKNLRKRMAKPESGATGTSK